MRPDDSSSAQPSADESMPDATTPAQALDDAAATAGDAAPPLGTSGGHADAAVAASNHGGGRPMGQEPSTAQPVSPPLPISGNSKIANAGNNVSGCCQGVCCVPCLMFHSLDKPHCSCQECCACGSLHRTLLFIIIISYDYLLDIMFCLFIHYLLFIIYLFIVYLFIVYCNLFLQLAVEPEALLSSPGDIRFGSFDAEELGRICRAAEASQPNAADDAPAGIWGMANRFFGGVAASRTAGNRGEKRC